MKLRRALASITLAMMLGKLALTLANLTVWPLNPYNMYSFRMHNPAEFYFLRARFSDGRTADLYPWEILPTNMYSSYKLVGWAARNGRADELSEFIIRYHRERSRELAWRQVLFPRASSVPSSAIETLSVVSGPLSMEPLHAR